MLFVLLFLAVSICAFILYILSKQDFVLLRQNISLSEIFDLAILTLISGLAFGRFFYIITDSRLDLFSPVKFFHIIKFPGFSILGLFLGGAFALFFALHSNKGLARIYDIFSISFMPIYIFALVTRDYTEKLFFIPIILFLLMILIFTFFINSHYRYIMRDGSLSLMLLLILGFDTFASPYLTGGSMSFWPMSLSQIASMVFVLVSLVGILAIQRPARR